MTELMSWFCSTTLIAQSFLGNLSLSLFFSHSFACLYLLFSLAQFRLDDIQRPKSKILKTNNVSEKAKPLTFTVFSLRTFEKGI